MQPLESIQPLGHAISILLPGIAAHAWFFGPGIWISLVLCSLLGLLFEALAVALRGYPLKPALSDGSALVSATLLALALPAYCPWWLTVIACVDWLTRVTVSSGISLPPLART